MVLITFLIQDHIYWLLKVGLLKFQNYTAVQWHRRNLRFITFSHVLNFSLCLRSILRVKAKQAKQDPAYVGSEQAVQKAKSEIYDNQRMMFRYSCGLSASYPGACAKKWRSQQTHAQRPGDVQCYLGRDRGRHHSWLI